MLVKVSKWSTVLQVLLVIATYAYGQDVHYNYDRSVSFGSYRTYQWVDLPGRVADPLIEGDIKRSVDEQLTQKGLTKVDKGADLYVGYHSAVDFEKGVDLWSTGFGGPGGFGDRTVRGQTSTIPVGVLLVDLYDSAKKQLIWRGDASGAIDLKKDPDKNYKTLRKAMIKLFKTYPPQDGK
jgi:hypothetical protein